jgi:glycyl-tRNA synthetase beta chain
VLALHGDRVLQLELFGVGAGSASAGHRFLSCGPVTIEHPDRYGERLRGAHVIADPEERRCRIDAAVREAAGRAGGTIVPDPALLEEVADLVEWPGVVAGGFDPEYLQLPREILVTTLRHHQKCFSVQGADGALRAGFVAVANTEHDPGGHIRRGNEWVIGGRLEDARFFWREDRRRPLAARGPELDRVVFHEKLGSYAEKTRHMQDLADRIASVLELDETSREHCRAAAGLAKNDLVTATVGEFPELQGRIGGLLLEAEDTPQEIARAVYEHYQPVGPDDETPRTDAGAVVSLADRLDTIARMIAAGEQPTGSRDPFGLRRSASGIFRIVIAKRWPLSLDDLWRLATANAQTEPVHVFLSERFGHYLREAGASPNEIWAVLRPTAAPSRPLHDLAARVDAIRAVRERPDFAHLVDLTKRVDNILTKGGDVLVEVSSDIAEIGSYRETEPAAIELDQRVDRQEKAIVGLENAARYADIVDVLAGFVEPVDKFFAEVLVIDPDHPDASQNRYRVLARLRGVLTRCFDIRELAGQAERRSS